VLEYPLYAISLFDFFFESLKTRNRGDVCECAMGVLLLSHIIVIFIYTERDYYTERRETDDRPMDDNK